MSMRWECRKPDLISTLIYMPTPTRHPQTQGNQNPGLCMRTHTHTHTNTRAHAHSLTPGHRPTRVLPPPLSEKKTAPSLVGERVSAGGAGWGR